MSLPLPPPAVKGSDSVSISHRRRSGIIAGKTSRRGSAGVPPPTEPLLSAVSD